MLALFLSTPVTGIRLSVFIDGGYLFKVCAPYSGAGYRYSCKRLIRRLSENYNLEKVHYVNSINLRNAAIRVKQEKFYYDYLKNRLGWEVEILPLQWPGGIAQQKGTDSTVTLLLQNAALANECDVVILLAADSDFVPPVELVKKLGKIVRNAYFSSRPSYHLQQACNGTPIRLDDIDFIYKDGNPQDLITLASLKGTI